MCLIKEGITDLADSIVIILDGNSEHVAHTKSLKHVELQRLLLIATSELPSNIRI